MAWDPALLRKFNATGHFRLLNQVRSELKANPIKRAAPSAADQASSRGPATGKPLDLRSQGYGRRRSSGGSSSASSSASNASAASTAPTPAPLPVAPLSESLAAAPAPTPSPWGRSSSASSPAPSSVSSPEASLPAERGSQSETGSTAEGNSRSFRDRLNAIQMR